MLEQREKLEFEISARLIDEKEIWGTTELKSDISKLYIEFILNHTLPAVNSRGRCVTYRTQKRSIKSIPDSLVNVEHMMQDNPNEATEDLVIGHMVKAKIEDLKDNPIVPDRPIPTKVLACLYRRLPVVKEIERQIRSGRRNWRNSMECVRLAASDAIYYNGKFFPIDKNPELAACVGQDDMQPYKDKPTALALGGEDGEINFWGSGLTLYPADKGATITKLIATIANDGSMSVKRKINDELAAKDLNLKSSEVSDKATKVLKCPKCGNTAFQEMMTVEGQTPREAPCPLCKTKMDTAKKGDKDIVVNSLPKLMIHTDGTEAGTEIYINGNQLNMENIDSIHFSYYPTPEGKDRTKIGPSSPITFGYSREETYDGVRRRVSYYFFVQEDGTIASKKVDEDGNEAPEKLYGIIRKMIDLAIVSKKEGGDK